MTRKHCTALMVRLVLRWIDSPWAFELLPGLNRLGRNPTNDFRISDPSVSSFHVEVLLEGDTIKVRDLGSTNGTFINEIKTLEGVLTPDSILRLGNVRFAIQEVPVVPVTPAPAQKVAVLEMQVELTPACSYHRGQRADYRCENCGGAFCKECVTVVGQGKFEATTVCPVCHDQCYLLPNQPQEPQRRGLLSRLTDTLRLPFSR